MQLKKYVQNITHLENVKYNYCLPADSIANALVGVADQRQAAIVELPP